MILALPIALSKTLVQVLAVALLVTLAFDSTSGSIFGSGLSSCSSYFFFALVLDLPSILVLG